MSTVVQLAAQTQGKLPKNTPIRGFVQAVNEVVDQINEEGEWSFWQKKTDIVLLDEYNDGTVEMTQGSVAVTGTGTAFTEDMVGRKFTSSSTEVYTIAARNNGTEIELDTAFVSDSASGKTFSIYQDTFALPSDLRKAIGFWDETIQRVVGFVSPLLIKDMDTSISFSSNGFGGRLVGQFTYNSSNVPQVIFYPRPTTAAKIPVWYYKFPTAVTGPSGTPDMPTEMHNLIGLGLIAHYTRDKNDFENFQRALKKRKKMDDGLMEAVPVRIRDTGLYDQRYLSRYGYPGRSILGIGTIISEAP